MLLCDLAVCVDVTRALGLAVGELQGAKQDLRMGQGQRRASILRFKTAHLLHILPRLDLSDMLHVLTHDLRLINGAAGC